jgi:small-conductance mechanosensitive channel
MSKKSKSSSLRIALLILIVIAAGAVGLFAYYLEEQGLIPASFAVPVYAAVILVSGYLEINIVSAMLETVVQPKLGVTRTRGIKNFFQVVAAIALIAVTVATFGFNLTGVLVGAGFLGIVLGLAAQQVLGNVFAGLSMFASRPFKIGDRVTLATSAYSLQASTYAHEAEVSGFTGVVQDIGIFFTSVLLDDGTHSIFPNSVVINSLVINHTRTVTRNIRVRMELDKKVDYPTFKAKLLESLKKYEGLDVPKSTVEIADVGLGTYQIVIVVWAGVPRESARTQIIEEALRVQKELAPPDTQLAATAPGEPAATAPENLRLTSGPQPGELGESG